MDSDHVFEIEDNLDEQIKLEGNFFIMDSEQLVSNPFQDLHQETAQAAEASKKNSMTERLTSVKNNVCENHYQMARSCLDRQQTSRLKQLHDHANRLRHEVKLLDLDRQRHTVEVKKRMDPDKDYSYDEGQIHNTERRLGANIASFYLDKKLKYPMRIRSMKDIRVTPTISRARAKIRTNALARPTEDSAASSTTRPERAHTAKTSSSTPQTGSSAAFRRRGSRSAPLCTRNARSCGGKPLFPAISTGKGTAASGSHGLVANDDHGAENAASNNNNQQVKFAFENPLKILASSEESANMFARSCTYYPGSTKAVNFDCESSSEDETWSEPERIDLKAILFPDDKPPAGPTHSSLSQHQIWALRKAQGPAPKLSTNKKEEEANIINAKIDKFLENLTLSRLKKRRRRRGSDSEHSEEDPDYDLMRFGGFNHNDNENSIHNKLTATTTGTTPHKNDENKNNTTTVTTTTSKPTVIVDDTSNSKGTSTADLLFDDTKLLPAQPVESSSMGHRTLNPVGRANTFIGSDYQTAADSPGTDSTADSPRKYSWRCIRGKQSDGKLRGTYRTEDLVIQALTGVPLSNALSTHIPMHSASRAMRHNATFKMHKIVEKLIHDRTKYERHQVEEIKRQQQEQHQDALTADSVDTPGKDLSRRVSKVSVGLSR